MTTYKASTFAVASVKNSNDIHLRFRTESGEIIISIDKTLSGKLAHTTNQLHISLSQDRERPGFVKDGSLVMPKFIEGFKPHHLVNQEGHKAFCMQIKTTDGEIITLALEYAQINQMIEFLQQHKQPPQQH